MPNIRKQTFKHLSQTERAVVGEPDDYEWASAFELPARPRSETVQFSLRVDRGAYESLSAIAREQKTTFSDVAREAISRYVSNGGKPALTNVQVSFRRDQGMLVQVEGGRAEIQTSRRFVDPTERAVLGEGAVTS